jgi:hypothetical protein
VARRGSGALACSAMAPGGVVLGVLLGFCYGCRRPTPGLCSHGSGDLFAVEGAVVEAAFGEAGLGFGVTAGAMSRPPF